METDDHGIADGAAKSARPLVRSPEEALTDLLESVDNVCDWLDYEFKVADIEAALRGLNHYRIKYLIALSKARGDVDAID